jgi:hypothetical protein
MTAFEARFVDDMTLLGRRPIGARVVLLTAMPPERPPRRCILQRRRAYHLPWRAQLRPIDTRSELGNKGFRLNRIHVRCNHPEVLAALWGLTQSRVASESWCKSSGRFAASSSSIGLGNSGEACPQLPLMVSEITGRGFPFTRSGCFGRPRADTAGREMFSRRGFGRLRSVC